MRSSSWASSMSKSRSRRCGMTGLRRGLSPGRPSAPTGRQLGKFSHERAGAVADDRFGGGVIADPLRYIDSAGQENKSPWRDFSCLEDMCACWIASSFAARQAG